MSKGVVVLGGNWQRGICPMGVIVLLGSCPIVVVPTVIILGIVVSGVDVLESQHPITRMYKIILRQNILPSMKVHTHLMVDTTYYQLPDSGQLKNK